MSTYSQVEVVFGRDSEDMTMGSSTTNRQLAWVVIVLITAGIVVPAIMIGFGVMGMGSMMSGDWSHGMWSMGEGAIGWMFLVGFALQLVFIAFLVVAGYLIYRTLASRAEPNDPAIAEIRSAYARGEIDDDEFERRRERLESDQ